MASLCLFYKYFYGNCFDELFKSATRLATKSHCFTVELACSVLIVSFLTLLTGGTPNFLLPCYLQSSKIKMHLLSY